MFRTWKCSLRVTERHATILVMGPEGDLLKARLDTSPCHPRALLTLLEGLSLWSGEPLSVALSVAERFHSTHASTLFGDGLFPAESGLVRFELAAPGPRKARLDGLGDFRAHRRSAR